MLPQSTSGEAYIESNGKKNMNMINQRNNLLPIDGLLRARNYIYRNDFEKEEGRDVIAQNQ